MMRIDDELGNSQVDQMIEGESYERLLEQRDERFWQIVRQRSQARAESGAEDECLCE
jgi:hypothetical protein